MFSATCCACVGNARVMCEKLIWFLLYAGFAQKTFVLCLERCHVFCYMLDLHWNVLMMSGELSCFLLHVGFVPKTPV